MPEIKEEHFEYLDGLRESGATNMFGAAEYLAEEFGLEYKRHGGSCESRTILTAWMETFDGKSSVADRVAQANAKVGSKP